MAQPNIKALTLIHGRSAAQAVTATSVDLVSNAVASGKF